MSKECRNCKYEPVKAEDHPCNNCIEYSQWTVPDKNKFYDAVTWEESYPSEAVADKMFEDIRDSQQHPDRDWTEQFRKSIDFLIKEKPDKQESVPGVEQLPDSGKRREFPTGSVRDVRGGKGRYDLISPFGIYPLAKRLEDGMSKYGERNWEKGQPLMSYLDSAIRHIDNLKEDFLLGRKHKEDHLGAAMWNLHCYAHTLRMIQEGLLPKELDDRPFPERVGLRTESDNDGK